MPFFWLKFLLTSCISLGNSKTLNPAYKVPHGRALQMAPLFHALTMLRSHWHMLQAPFPAVYISRLMHFSFTALTTNCNYNLHCFLWLFNVFPAHWSLSSLKEGMGLFCSALCTQYTEQCLCTP